MKRRAVLLALAGAAPLAADTRPSEDRIYRFEPQSLTVEDFAADGLILDLGGGGEGIIARVKGQQVVAIDLSQRDHRGSFVGVVGRLFQGRRSRA